jgi:ATP-dependent DNA helicase RecG
MSKYKGTLDLNIEYIKGVGPARAELLKSELGLYKAGDLLEDFPVKHIDRSGFQKIRDIKEEGQYIQLVGQITHLEVVGEGRAKRLSGLFADDTGAVELVWFRGHRYLINYLKSGQLYIVYGRVSFYRGKPNIAHPELEPFEEGKNREVTTRIFPVYKSTEKLNTKGLDAKVRRRIVKELLFKLRPADIPEFLPDYIVSSLKLISAYEARITIHQPEDQAALLKAEKRLKFEELFLHQLQLLYSREVTRSKYKGPVFAEVGNYFNTFYEKHLTFELTDAQKRVIREIRTDVKTGQQMNRLLQGDVGSGKTIVALMTMLLAIDNDYQACLMAPTEILAQQHYEGISNLVDGIGLQVGFLSGTVKGKKRKEVLSKLVTGELHILIGTHALLEDPVVYARLGLAITDEQHRFGVEQRARLWTKGKPNIPPHVLVMTATPIPRTLAMTLYGDLDVSIIDELPPGRKPVKTTYRSELKRPEVISFMRQQIEAGRQIYVVYPLIEESEKIDLQDLQNGYERLLQYFPTPHYQISVVHGRMKPEAKEFEMKRFVEGTTQIMVATTVIEVGVNVPNASVMVIENAERFGLSQLHQLRGRVGRGADQSYCILMTNFKLTEDARERLNTMSRTNDGFEIAEVDLRLRGPGAIEGTQQSGLPGFKLANLAKDGPILTAARNAALQILEKDPQLHAREHATLMNYIKENLKGVKVWSKIS